MLNDIVLFSAISAVSPFEALYASTTCSGVSATSNRATLSSDI